MKPMLRNEADVAQRGHHCDDLILRFLTALAVAIALAVTPKIISI